MIQPESDNPDPGLSRDDLALIEAAITDPAAFEPLYRLHAPAIYRFCYRQLAHSDAAADATSQGVAITSTAYNGGHSIPTGGVPP